MNTILSLIFSCLFLSGAANALELPSQYVDTPEDINIYIQTVDEGNLVYDNFGHTLVRVENTKTRKNYIYNWGVFSFGEPVVFALNFYKGYLDYTLGIVNFGYMMRVFHYDQRTVWEDKLNLNNEQKKIFLDKLVWNQKPENRNYLYQYFDDNCSTRPRDYINLAMNGKFEKEFEGKEGKFTYRELIRDAYASIPPMSMILDTILNSEIDKRMTLWQEAFLPESLRKLLLEADNNGEKLISSSHTLVSAKTKKKYKETGYEVFLILFGILIFLEVMYMNFSMFSISRRIVNGLILTTWGIWSGLLGVLFPITWLVSDHVILKHNALMLLYLPLDFYFILLGLSLIFRNRIPCRDFYGKYMKLHTITYALLLFGFITGIIKQDVSRSLYFVCPGFIISLFLLYINERDKGSQ